MVDLTAEMTSLWSALGPASDGRGRVIQFVAAAAGAGTSTVAREFARLAAVRARKPVWLVDADLDRQSQLAAVAQEPDRFGALGRVAGASPDGSSWFTVQPPVRDRQGRPVADAMMATARPALGARLWITRLRLEAMTGGQRAHVLPIPTYWEAMRRHADFVVVDCPSADRSDVAASLARFVDATVLVLAAEETEAVEAGALRDALEAAGGTVAGIVFNRARFTPPKILQRLVS